MMLHKILVPTDFSKNALKAAYYASEISIRTGAVIYLLHVIEPAIDMVRMMSVSTRKRAIKESTSDLILLHKALIKAFPNIKVVRQLSGGTVIDSITSFAEKIDADLIVMGTSGASGLKELFIGSVTAGVIGKTRVPLLTVPASYEMEEPDAILIATNQFEKDKNTINRVVIISKLFSAAIHVLIFKDSEGNENADFIYNEGQLNNYLKFLRETYPEVVFRGEIIEGNDFELCIDQYCNKHGIDVITMFTYPKSLIKKILRKGVTRKMALHSTIPVFAVPAIN